MDGPKSDEVRRYLIENTLYWVHEFHVDSLRLDAIHAIHDETASPFLMELVNVVERYSTDLNHRVYLIAESDDGSPFEKENKGKGRAWPLPTGSG